jgi:hypothetical protein
VSEVTSKAHPRVTLDRPETQRRRSALPAWQRRLLGDVAAAIRTEAAEPIKRPEAERIARYLVSLLVPRRIPGKKASPQVVAAAKLKQEGRPWIAIFTQVFANFSDMPRYERNWRCFRLRRAVAAYAKRRLLRESNNEPTSS